MAEGFARHWGDGFVSPTSSGLAPTRVIAAETIATMKAFGIDITSQYPKKFDPYATGQFDLIVNLSGFYLPGKPIPPVDEWRVDDPYGESEAIYTRCALEIEQRVKLLIEDIRNPSGPPIANLVRS